MTLTTAAETVRHETPNAVMRTLAAPSTGSAELSVWEVSMRAGQRGPVHTVDHEQVWLVVGGRLRATIAAETSVAAAGDALVIAGGAERQVEAATDLTAIVSSLAGSVVTTPDAPGGRPLPWAA
jgi:quercetin dioxygenase-like cupin family protein